MVTAKRNAKDTVFSDLFEKPEYLLQLYQALHPEDTEATADMLQDATIQNILTDRIYNDLGFVVRDKLMILVEAQSTWSVNIIVRALIYLAQSFQDRFESRNVNLYSTKAVQLPEPELYVIYTGDRSDHPDTLRLSEEFFGGKATALDVTVKMLYGDDRTTIIGQYVRFCKVLNEQLKKYGSTNEAVLETVRICKDENVLKDYLATHEQEAVSIMMALFNEEYIQKAYGYECKQEGIQEGMQKGVQIGMQKGMQKGRKEGRQEGKVELSRVIQRLISAGRIGEIDRVTRDDAYYEQVKKEFAI